MNLSQLIGVLFTLILVTSLSEGLRILFVLPCYGGHFGAMLPLITSLSETNNVTVIQTSSTCKKKLAPFRNRSSFNLIEEEIYLDDVHFTNFLQGLWNILTSMYENNMRTYEYLDGFLSKYRDDFDLMIGDSSQQVTLLAGEAANIPTAVIITGFPGGVENVIEKQEVPMVELMVIKLVFYRYFTFFMEHRASINLPPLSYEGGYSVHEYISRFPSLIATSPKFYPEHHESIPHIFLGGPRNASDYGPLDDNLVEWLSQKQTAVIYLSLGTLFTLTEGQITDFVEKVRFQERYAVIWSLGNEMRSLVNHLNLVTDEKLFFSDFLPQYTLLGHEKVKVFVTHGGLGSTIDLIKRRKPSVCAPQIFDQFFNCKKLTSLSVTELVSSFSFESINDSIHKILENYQKYVENADLIAKDFEFYEKREKIESFLSKVAAKGETEVIKKFEFKFCSEKCSQAWMMTKIILFFCASSFLLLILIIIRCSFKKCRSKTIKPKQN